VKKKKILRNFCEIPQTKYSGPDRCFVGERSNDGRLGELLEFKRGPKRRHKSNEERQGGRSNRLILYNNSFIFIKNELINVATHTSSQ